MAITVIEENGDLIAEVIEYDDELKNGNGNGPVKQTQQFLVSKEILIKNSTISAKKFVPPHRRVSRMEMVRLDEGSIASMNIWLRILHGTDPDHYVPLEEMWRLVAACDKYHFNLTLLKPWFAEWYKKYDNKQYYRNWASKDDHRIVRLDPRALLYPCYIFDHAEGFMEATRFLSYNAVGHITEYNPTTHHNLRLPSRVIQQLNAAKGRLRTVIHNELFRPNEDLLKASCNCKEKTLFCYEKAMYDIEVWPLERTCQKSSIRTIIERLDDFSFTAEEGACNSCRQDYKATVKAAQKRTRFYFDGLCLDCMDRTKPMTKDEDMDYWQHDTLRENDWIHGCRGGKHRQPTWYFSFMGRLEIRDRLRRNQRARKCSRESD